MDLLRMLMETWKCVFVIGLNIVGLIINGVVFADEEGISLEISQGVIFKRHGPILLECRYNPKQSEYEVKFAWHHNGSQLMLGEPNSVLSGTYIYVYRYRKEDAMSKDAGTYACNIEGKPGAAATIVKEILVDEKPVIGEMNLKVTLSLLETPQNDILCYTGMGNIRKVENCIENLVLADDNVGVHSFLLGSASAIRHYGTIQNTMENEVGINLYKPVIGLSVKQNGNKVTLELDGDKTSLAEITPKCAMENDKTLDVEEMETETKEKLVFSCERKSTESKISVEILWKNQTLFNKVLEEDVSSGDRISIQLLVYLFCGVILYTLYS